MADFPSDDPRQWYEVGGLYCLACRHFEFAGVGGNDDIISDVDTSPGWAAGRGDTSRGDAESRSSASRSSALMTASVNVLKFLRAPLPRVEESVREVIAPAASFEMSEPFLVILHPLVWQF